MARTTDDNRLGLFVMSLIDWNIEACEGSLNGPDDYEPDFLRSTQNVNGDNAYIRVKTESGKTFVITVTELK